MHNVQTDIGIEISLHMIDRLLIDKRMTRKDLADKIGAKKQHVSMWLNGKVPIPERHMVAIAKALGVDSRVIFPDRKALEKLADRRD
jgi:transcriptional regulator with XRE-family HTH domain